jgi:exopolyphosphatase/guanosine-5'-triphosphate,3'-diphosphate pyrophosphatase
MNKEKIAIIDLGTNTFHLLIAERTNSLAKIILNEKVSVKIGQGGISKNFIASDAYQRALKTLSGFKTIMYEHAVSATYAFATSAVRNARNGYTLVKDIKDLTGIEVKVISGEEEANFIYEGVKFALDLGKSISVIMDIGGGSVEFIICNQESIFWKGSFEIGAQRLLDMFHRNDPITNEELEQLVIYLDEKLLALYDAAKVFKPFTLVGASGAFDTLCDIDINRKDIHFSLKEEKDYVLSLNDFEEIAFDILSKNREQRMEIPGMIEMRADMIVVASVLIQVVAHRLKVQKIRVCSYALKEGVLSRLLKGEKI